MRDYLTTYLRYALGQATSAMAGVVAGYVTPEQLTKLTKPLPEQQQTGSVSFGSLLPRTYPENRRTHAAIKRKVWRRAPYWQACAETTRLPSGAIDLEATDLLYTALALREGHTPDEVREMLRAVTPCASLATDYCAQIVRRASANPAVCVTTQQARKYTASHPFAFELGLYRDAR